MSVFSPLVTIIHFILGIFGGRTNSLCYQPGEITHHQYLYFLHFSCHYSFIQFNLTGDLRYTTSYLYWYSASSSALSYWPPGATPHCLLNTAFSSYFSDPFLLSATDIGHVSFIDLSDSFIIPFFFFAFSSWTCNLRVLIVKHPSYINLPLNFPGFTNDSAITWQKTK